MLRFVNVATPLTAATETVPDRFPPSVPSTIESVTVLVAVLAVLPSASWIATETGKTCWLVIAVG